MADCQPLKSPNLYNRGIGNTLSSTRRTSGCRSCCSTGTARPRDRIFLSCYEELNKSKRNRHDIQNSYLDPTSEQLQAKQFGKSKKPASHPSHLGDPLKPSLQRHSEVSLLHISSTVPWVSQLQAGNRYTRSSLAQPPISLSTLETRYQLFFLRGQERSYRREFTNLRNLGSTSSRLRTRSTACRRS